MPGPHAALARELTLRSAVALVVGQVIAVGIFLTPGTIIRTLASPLWVLIVWALIGGMALCGALCYGALAARYPHAGGGYVYLREAFGPRVAFLYGWKCFLVMDPGITAALAWGVASYVGFVVPATTGAGGCATGAGVGSGAGSSGGGLPPQATANMAAAKSNGKEARIITPSSWLRAVQGSRETAGTGPTGSGAGTKTEAARHSGWKADAPGRFRYR